MNQTTGIMRQKVETYIQESTENNPEKFRNLLKFTDGEINHVEESPGTSGNAMIGISTKLVL